MKHENFCVLCVDDDLDLLELMKKTFQNENFELKCINDPSEVPEFIEKNINRLLCVISDLKMSGMDGLELRKKILQNFKDLPFILVSGFITKELAVSAIEHQISALISKPFSLDEIRKTTREITKDRHANLQEKRDISEMFLMEAQTYTEEMEDLLLTLENDPTNENVANSLFRLVHTIKGSAASVQLQHIAKYSHHFEDLLSKVKNKQMLVSSEIISVFLKGLDILRQMISSSSEGSERNFDIEELVTIFEIEKKQSNTVSGQSAKSQIKQENIPETGNQQNQDFVRVGTNVLDEFMEMSGEITLLRNMIKKMVRGIAKQSSAVKEVSQLTEMLEEMHKINNRIQGKVVEMRKVPLKHYCKSIPRAVRDLSKSLNKKVNFEFEGEDLEIDHSLSSVISDSLLHIVRNSLDHGLETPEVRRKNGKSEFGSLKLRGFEDRTEVRIEIIDDGRGLDAQKILQKAIEKGIIDAEGAAKLSERQIFNLILLPGFSTAEKVTELSGRGVGMDMVRSSVEHAKGHLEIASKLGEGTRVTLRLPIPKSVLIIAGLLVECQSQTFAIPNSNILYVSKITREKQNELTMSVEGCRLLKFDSRLIPIVELKSILKLDVSKEKQTNVDEELSLVVVKAEASTYALLVDSIIDGEDIVVKPLNKHLNGLQAYSGSTFLGDADICMILDIKGIAQMANLSSEISENSVNKTSQTSGVCSNNAVSLSGDPSTQDYVAFTLENNTRFAVPMSEVYRLEDFTENQIEQTFDNVVTNYRNSLMPLFPLDEILRLSPKGKFMSCVNRSLNGGNSLLQSSIIISRNDKLFAFAVDRIVDISKLESELDTTLVTEQYGLGHAKLGHSTHFIISLHAVLETLYPSTAAHEKSNNHRDPHPELATQATNLESVAPVSLIEDDGILWVV